MHCAHSGMPIVGDTKYGIEHFHDDVPVATDPPLHLQAMELKFTNPLNGAIVHLKLDEPADWNFLPPP